MRLFDHTAYFTGQMHQKTRAATEAGLLWSHDQRPNQFVGGRVWGGICPLYLSQKAVFRPFSGWIGAFKNAIYVNLMRTNTSNKPSTIKTHLASSPPPPAPPFSSGGGVSTRSCLILLTASSSSSGLRDGSSGLASCSWGALCCCGCCCCSTIGVSMPTSSSAEVVWNAWMCSELKCKTAVKSCRLFDDHLSTFIMNWPENSRTVRLDVSLGVTRQTSNFLCSLVV